MEELTEEERIRAMNDEAKRWMQEFRESHAEVMRVLGEIEDALKREEDRRSRIEHRSLRENLQAEYISACTAAGQLPDPDVLMPPEDNP